MKLLMDRLSTPIGDVLLVTDDQAQLRALDFHDYEARMLRLLRAHYGAVDLVEGTAPESVRTPLQAYFAGDHGALRQVAWQTGGTPFQRSVWAALTEIPSGETRSYGQLAEALGRPGSSRAVGWANGSNPIAIVLPCHRVIAASGKLSGYAGGLHRKQWLLEHEGVRSPMSYS